MFAEDARSAVILERPASTSDADAVPESTNSVSGASGAMAVLSVSNTSLTPSLSAMSTMVPLLMKSLAMSSAREEPA